MSLPEFLGNDLNDPERPRTGESIHEAVSLVGISEDGRIVVGRQARPFDTSFPLKTMIALRALGTENEHIVREMPGGPELLEAKGLGIMTPQSMDDTFARHLNYLKDTIRQHAASQGVKITAIGLTYPNFWEEQESNTNRLHLILVDYMEGMVYSCFGSDASFRSDVSIRVSALSEGQATAKCVSQRYWDALTGAYRKQIQKLFPNLAQDPQVVLVTVDAGSSSVVRF